jgi:hypothetical protein
MKATLPKKKDGVQKKSLTPEQFRQKVERQAYELFESRGCPSGDDQADWFEAEKVVTREYVCR